MDEHHTVDGVRYLCHADDHYCPSAQHHTCHLGFSAPIHVAEAWMRVHNVTWGPAALSDPLTRFGIYAFAGNGSLLSLQERLRLLANQPLLVVETDDTLCWDGTRVQLHASYRQGVETCTTKEAHMIQKRGTGNILTETEDDRIVRTAALSEAQLADILEEGEEADTEEE